MGSALRRRHRRRSSSSSGSGGVPREKPGNRIRLPSASLGQLGRPETEARRQRQWRVPCPRTINSPGTTDDDDGEIWTVSRRENARTAVSVCV